MANLVGKTLGKYKLTERLGSGGMAEVYKAYHPILDRYVTIKILHSFLAEGQDFLARFQREARAVATLRHPHIQQIHDFDIEGDIYYMVMEFIDWGTLQTRMMDLSKSGAYMPVDQVLSILQQVAEALDYAHKQGIIHRDIKPSNILLDTKGNAFLSDFGIARMMSGTQFTATGSLIGTPTYMSPEQGMGGDLAPVSDIYSLGVILFELLTGKVPFTSETTPLAIIHKHIHEPPPNPRALRPDLTEAAEQVVLKVLAKDPKERYQSAGELIRALEKAMTEETIAKLDSSGVQASVAVSTLPTMLVEEAEPAVDRANLPTVAMEEATGVETASPPMKVETKNELIPPATGMPILKAPPRWGWIILLAGLGFFISRFLVEFLAWKTNLYGLVKVFEAFEIVVGISGVCVGALLWLALRSIDIHLKRPQIIALLAIWCASYLTIGIFAFSIDPLNGTVWHLAYALPGLLGGLFTGLLLRKIIPQFGIKQVLLLSCFSGISLSLGDFALGLLNQFWLNSQIMPVPLLKIGIANFLTGILITWALLFILRPRRGPVSPSTPNGAKSAGTAVHTSGSDLTPVGSTRMVWLILMVAGGCFLGRFLVEYLARVGGLFRLGIGFTAAVIMALFGLCVGALLWLALHLAGLKLNRPHALLLLAVWSSAYLSVALTAFLIDFTSGTSWTIGYAVGGLLGGMFTGLILMKAFPLFRLRHLVILGLLSPVFVLLGNSLPSNIDLWSALPGALQECLRLGISSALTGLIISWTVFRLTRPRQAMDSPSTKSAGMEWVTLFLVFGWMLVRFLSEFIGLTLYPMALDIPSPFWQGKTSLVLALTGLLSGFTLWLVLRLTHMQMKKWTPLALPLFWAGGYLLFALPLILLRVGNTWYWAACLGLGTAIAGAGTAMLLKPENIHWYFREWITVGVFFGLGTALGNLVFSMALPGLSMFPANLSFSLSGSLHSCFTALLGGTVLLLSIYRPRQWFEWRFILSGLIGFALAALLSDWLYDLFGQNSFANWLTYAVYGFVIGMTVSLPTRKIWRVLQVALLSMLGFLLANYLWTWIRIITPPVGIATIFWITVGFIPAFFIAAGSRLQWALILALALTLSFLLSTIIPLHGEFNTLFFILDMLRSGIVGIVLGFFIGNFAIFTRASAEVLMD